MKNTKTDYLRCRELFYKFMSEGQPVFDKDGNELILKDGEEFRQCYDPNDNIRNTMPKSWFVSNYCNLISVYGKKVRWLKMDLDEQGRGAYHWYINEEHIKRISAYALRDLIFGAYKYGKAEGLLNEKGVYAFGHASVPDNLQCHHPDKRSDSPEKLYEPGNTEIVTYRMHDLIHKAPDHKASPKDEAEYMNKLLKAVSEEAPNQITFVATGEVYHPSTDTWEKDKAFAEKVDSVRFMNKPSDLSVLRLVAYDKDGKAIFIDLPGTSEVA